MPERKPLQLRLDPATLDALRAWATEDLRSINGQIEFLLRRALREAGRLPAPRAAVEDGAQAERRRLDADDTFLGTRAGGERSREQAGHIRSRRERHPALTEER